MRKDRNTFFSESNMYQSNYPGTQGMGQQPMMMQQPGVPYQASTASNSFYSGPNPNMTQGMAPAGINPNVAGIPSGNTITAMPTSDIETRIAKLERQIRRLETRANKLESNYTTPYSTVEEAENISNNMYMI